MNIERLIRMIVRMFTRKLMNRGIDAGLDYATRKGDKDKPVTQENRERAKQTKAIAKKARQGARLARRIGRM